VYSIGKLEALIIISEFYQEKIYLQFTASGANLI
jgi:hypothetical protein